MACVGRDQSGGCADFGMSCICLSLLEKTGLETHWITCRADLVWTGLHVIEFDRVAPSWFELDNTGISLNAFGYRQA